ncbi:MULTISPECIES: hypothetical protein [unclassified Sphingomonas]|uniref:hypothetical protein n=1 Tax=unclassified Sphingomonas TaxID=196159 RepID=UPI0006FACF51|nr:MULTISPECIES: hypothetical protein [unclassified Sphingomonas]KQX17837.1 hypothetical protein ASD17_19225 [Sphingomonas sp. Root1294]KQY70763.1 hypothetical protein ASD39_23125 [Sphingomonas sp. Root50]KRB91744.1 hypothetical protein ASE22_07185 [Sphingomonas sp. Root720]
MITNRFKEVVWTGGICVAALSFYMISQTVAAKRAELAGVERKIASTHQEIRRLRTEIDTRGGLAQIEKWNQSVYGLQAPGPEQFVTSSVRLVALTQPRQLPLDPAIVASHGALDKVSYDRIEDRVMDAPADRTVAAAPHVVAPPPQPALRQANYVQPRPSALAPQASPVHEVAERKLVRAVRLDDNFLDGLVEDAPARARKGKQ